VLGEEHPYTAQSYNNLAHTLQAQGKYKEAEEDHRKALELCRKSLGEEHPDTAIDYSNLANCLNKQGKYQEAEEDFHKALALRRKALGEEHPSTALTYYNLAGNLAAQGKYPEAEADLQKALTINRKTVGEEHPDTASNYNNLGQVLHALGDYREAERILRRAAESFDKARLHVAATGLERAVFTSIHSPLQMLSAVLARNGKSEDAWQRFEESLARGTWDDLTAHLRRPQAERDKQAEIIARIDRLNKLLEKASVAKPTPEQSKQRDELLSQLAKAYDELSTFAQQLEKKYGPVAGQIFSREKIQVSLTADTALLGWLDIPGQPKVADPNGEHWAVLLRSSGEPIWVRLTGSGDKNIWTDADTQLPGQLRDALQSSTGKWQPLDERLRQQRLQPLAQHLKGVRHLIVLPSTALAGVPVEVIANGYTVSYAHSGTMFAHLRQLPTPTGKGILALADPIFDASSLAEKTQPLPPGGVLVTMVAPGSNAAKAGLKPNDVLLRYGDTDLARPADFKPLPEKLDSDKDVPVIVWRDGQTRKQPLFVRPGKLGVVIAKEPAPQALARQRRLNRLLASRSGDDGKWPRLPGTRVEVAALQRLFASEPSRLLLDSQASEQRLNELAGSGALGKYRYLHLATHGEVDNSFPLRSAVILARDQLPDDNQRTELLVSGQPIPDGRLTAEEVLRRWNLNADLVTLSACQTALGKYERGEGYVGFAQALVLSGSRSVCLSLWKVNDRATALLMERFYENLLGKREGLDQPMAKAAALAEAKSWLRGLSRAEAVKRAALVSGGVDRSKHPGASLEVPPAAAPDEAAKRDRPYAHPYYWAAFMLVGHAD
jgi:CHAT domain-containing protein/tetratricopeptide (TPR) repeat protein